MRTNPGVCVYPTRYGGPEVDDDVIGHAVAFHLAFASYLRVSECKGPTFSKPTCHQAHVLNTRQWEDSSCYRQCKARGDIVFCGGVLVVAW